ncbi:UNVERIFIED_CONTAM: hypothetical protein HDU68_008000 [Siphonaria sp. JEL0065]|nr:hypothetical protein HDU68_008000 [Siphonaria sp. JEL0065]
MSPVEIEQATANLSIKESTLRVQPLKRNYSLDAFKSFKVQPHLGVEFEKSLKIRDILKAQNADELFHDLAVLVAERNVVFLRDQDITFEEQQEFADRLGKAGGKPTTAGLHLHPITDPSDEFGAKRLEISSEYEKKKGATYGGFSGLFGTLGILWSSCS